jgi:hypothetical protein
MGQLASEESIDAVKLFAGSEFFAAALHRLATVATIWFVTICVRDNLKNFVWPSRN